MRRGNPLVAWVARGLSGPSEYPVSCERIRVGARRETDCRSGPEQRPSEVPCLNQPRQQPAGAARDLAVQFQVDQSRGNQCRRGLKVADQLVFGHW